MGGAGEAEALMERIDHSITRNLMVEKPLGTPLSMPYTSDSFECSRSSFGSRKCSLTTENTEARRLYEERHFPSQKYSPMISATRRFLPPRDSVDSVVEIVAFDQAPHKGHLRLPFFRCWMGGEIATEQVAPICAGEFRPISVPQHYRTRPSVGSLFPESGR